MVDEEKVEKFKALAEVIVADVERHSARRRAMVDDALRGCSEEEVEEFRLVLLEAFGMVKNVRV